MPDTELLGWAVVSRHQNGESFRIRSTIVLAKAAAERRALTLVKSAGKGSGEQIHVVEIHAYPNVNN